MDKIIDNSGYPLTSGIGFHKEGRNLILTLSKRSLVSNMQSDAGAFEGWALCLFANNPGIYEKIFIQWNTIERFDKDSIITDAISGFDSLNLPESLKLSISLQPWLCGGR